MSKSWILDLETDKRQKNKMSSLTVKVSETQGWVQISKIRNFLILFTITFTSFDLEVLLDRKRDPDPFPISAIVISWV